MAPEVMLDKGEYTDKVDVYSGSMVVWYACVGVPPLVALHGEVVAELAARQELRPPLLEIIAITPDLASILQQGWHQDEDVRLDSATMLRMLQDLETNMLAAKKAKRGASIYNKLTTKLRGFSGQFLDSICITREVGHGLAFLAYNPLTRWSPGSTTFPFPIRSDRK